MNIHQAKKKISNLAKATDKKVIVKTDEVLMEIKKQNKKGTIRGYK